LSQPTIRASWAALSMPFNQLGAPAGRNRSVGRDLATLAVRWRDGRDRAM
jgi:hypothetical protein